MTQSLMIVLFSAGSAGTPQKAAAGAKADGEAAMRMAAQEALKKVQEAKMAKAVKGGEYYVAIHKWVGCGVLNQWKRLGM